MLGVTLGDGTVGAKPQRGGLGPPCLPAPCEDLGVENLLLPARRVSEDRASRLSQCPCAGACLVCCRSLMQAPWGPDGLRLEE